MNDSNRIVYYSLYDRKNMTTSEKIRDLRQIAPSLFFFWFILHMSVYIYFSLLLYFWDSVHQCMILVLIVWFMYIEKFFGCLVDLKQDRLKHGQV